MFESNFLPTLTTYFPGAIWECTESQNHKRGRSHIGVFTLGVMVTGAHAMGHITIESRQGSESSSGLIVLSTPNELNIPLTSVLEMMQEYISAQASSLNRALLG